MEILNSKKHKYAAKILDLGFHGNVESALKEADSWERGESSTLTEAYHSYYLVHGPDWRYPYIVKKIGSGKIERGQNPYGYPYPVEDINVKRFRW